MIYFLDIRKLLANLIFPNNSKIAIPFKQKDTMWMLYYRLHSTGQFINHITVDGYAHPVGDVRRVSVVPGKVTVKIGDVENRWWGCWDKNRLN